MKHLKLQCLLYVTAVPIYKVFLGGGGTNFFYIRFTRISERVLINPLTPNDHYSGRTAPLTSKVSFYIFIQQI